MNIPIASQTINFPGYGAFWVANSITSTVLGKYTRERHEEAQTRNLEFQQELERARFITDDERMQEDIAFKRRLMAISRQYKQEEGRASFNEQMKTVELSHYLRYCWPLDPQLPYVLLEELSHPSSAEPLLNVILMHAPLLPLRAYGLDANEKDAGIYEQLEYSIQRSDIPLIGNINYRADACKKADISGGNASIMNIHFLMGQMPTLVVSPQYREGKMYLSGAVWEPQAARPLIRPLLNFDFNPVLAENDEKYCKQAIELFHTSVSIIIGSVRDSYMLLTQGRKPTLPILLNDEKHKEMKRLVMNEKSLKEFVKQENQNVLAALDEKNMPRLLEVFNKEDIESIRDQVKSNDL